MCEMPIEPDEKTYICPTCNEVVEILATCPICDEVGCDECMEVCEICGREIHNKCLATVTPTEHPTCHECEDELYDYKRQLDNLKRQVVSMCSIMITDLENLREKSL